MPYVSDSQSFTTGTFPRPGGHVTCHYGTAKAQYGYRSGVINFNPDAAPTVVRGPTSRHTLEMLGNSEAYFTGRRSDGWAEHNRTYQEWVVSTPTHGQYTGVNPRYGFSATVTPYLMESVAPTFTEALPPSREIDRLAESLSRATVPDRPFTNVTRMMGELRDAPQLLAVANYIPRSTSDLGGSYLNQVFGVQPTVGDMQRLGEAVHRVIPAVRDEIAGCSNLIQARRAADLTKGYAVSSEFNTYRSALPSYLGTPYTGQAMCWGFDSLGSNFGLHVGISKTESSSLVAYGRYQRIVVRMDSMNRSLGAKLRPLLGSGASADTIYDLTPYTWLLNWVWDFGSVLRYQEALNGADVVAMAHGSTIERNARVGWTATVRRNPYEPSYSVARVTPASGYSRFRSSTRTGGSSPYSLTAGSWDTLSGTQWAILAALGLARSPGVPIFANTKKVPVYRDHTA